MTLRLSAAFERAVRELKARGMTDEDLARAAAFVQGPWVDLRCDIMDDGTVFWWITVHSPRVADKILASGMTAEEHLPEVDLLYGRFSGAYK